MNEVLDEIGINLSTDLVSAPNQQQAVAAEETARTPAEAMGMGANGGGDGPPRPPHGGPPPPPGGGGMPEPGSGIDDDLQARLNNLRKS